MKSSIFKVQFDDSVKEYNKVDGILAIAYFLYELLFTYLFGLLCFRSSWFISFSTSSEASSVINIDGPLASFVFYIPVALLTAGPVFIILKCRKQDLRSIGLKKEKILKCILLGILFSVPPTLPNIFSMKFGRPIRIPNALWGFAYFFLEIALPEEIVFRGFIQTRIQGLIRSKWLSIFLVATMSMLLHIPFFSVEYNTTFVNFFLSHIVTLTLVFLMHIYSVYLYTRDNNVLAPVVAHTLVDFIPVLFSAV
jgi:uncharacterized protein